MGWTRSWMAFAGAALVAGSLTPNALAADPRVTLKLAVADGEGRPSDPYVHAFVDEVAARSDGSVTLQPIFDAAGDDFEQGVAKMVATGQADLGLAAGRAWDVVGATSLDALQAPFLITDDALALAVAADPLADVTLAAMSGAGVVGLSLWPEDLRHPVAFEPCMPPLLTPADVKGRTIRATASTVTFAIISAMGGTPIFVNGYDPLVASCQIQGAESGLRQGASLPGLPTFTGDVTFFPKYQVLAANAGVFGRLTESQQAAIRDAAIAVRDRAIAEHPSEADAAVEWCAGGGTVALAGPDAVAAFQAAAAPVLAAIVADPVNAAAVDAIQKLKAATDPAPGATACAPTPATPAPSLDTTGYVATPIPAGVYRWAWTLDDLVAAGASRDFATNNFGTWTFELGDGTWTLQLVRASGSDDRCSGTWQATDGRVLRFTTTDGSDSCEFPAEIVWQSAPTGITMLQVNEDGSRTDTNAFFTKVAERIQ